jgi:hypothetical protein
MRTSSEIKISTQLHLTHLYYLKGNWYSHWFERSLKEKTKISKTNNKNHFNTYQVYNEQRDLVYRVERKPCAVIAGPRPVRGVEGKGQKDVCPWWTIYTDVLLGYMLMPTSSESWRERGKRCLSLTDDLHGWGRCVWRPAKREHWRGPEERVTILR